MDRVCYPGGDVEATQQHLDITPTLLDYSKDFFSEFNEDQNSFGIENGT